MLLAVLMAAAGCQKKQEEPKTTAKSKITLWHYWDIDKNQEHLAQLVEEFNGSQDEIEVSVQYVPDEDFKKQLTLSITEGTTPDMALVDCSDFQFFQSMEPFVELTDQIPQLEEYLPIALDSCSQGGKVYGLPFGLNCPALFYNKDIFEDMKIEAPKNWEEFTEAAVKTTRSGRYGFGISALQSEESLYEFLPILWSMGGDVYNLETAESRQAFQLLRDLTDEKAMSQQCVSLTQWDLAEQFMEGNIAMMFNGPMVVDSLRELAPEMNFGVVPIPSDKEQISVAGGEVLGVFPGKNQEAAITFLQYLADKERMASYLEGFGFLAPRQDVLDGQFSKDPVKKQFVEYFQTARPRDYTENWPQISRTITGAIAKSIAGDKEIPEILSEAAGKIDRIGEEKP